ncbi:MAG TPA: biopolymer transporter ExbD [Longimicrobiales bacterium]|nr:biopolymer transporter ExbD [Longimicrobiales bacterium]
MAMTTGGTGSGYQSNINITPMIDVLLVLLIIFLVIQPALQKGIEVQVPPVEEQEVQQEEQPPDQIILEIRPGPQYFINQIPVPPAQLEARIQSIFAPRPRKVLFVKGAEQLRYGDVVAAIDAARGGGIEVVGLVPREP